MGDEEEPYNEASSEIEVYSEHEEEFVNEICEIESDDENQSLITVEWEGSALIVARSTAQEQFTEEKWNFFLEQIAKIKRTKQSMKNLERPTNYISNEGVSLPKNNQDRQKYLRSLVCLGARNSIIMLSDLNNCLRTKYWDTLINVFEFSFTTECFCWRDLQKSLNEESEIESSIVLEINKSHPEDLTWYNHASELVMRPSGEKQIKTLICSLQGIESKFDIIFGQKQATPVPFRSIFISAQDIFMKYDLGMQMKKEWQEWARACCLHYAIEDQHVGLSRGVEYVCFSVLAHPRLSHSFDAVFATKVFLHLMQGQDFRQLYISGSPRFFKEVTLLQETLSEEVPAVADKFLRFGVDPTAVFASLYKTLLLYKLTSKEVMCKIVELLLIYGIPIITKIIVKVCAKMEQKLVSFKEDQAQNFGDYIANGLLNDYFQQSKKTSVHQMFKNLFIFN